MRNIENAQRKSPPTTKVEYKNYRDFLESYNESKSSKDDQESISSTDSGFSSYKLTENRSNNTSNSSLNSDASASSQKLKTESKPAFGSYKDFLENYNNKRFSSVRPNVNKIRSEIFIQVDNTSEKIPEKKIQRTSSLKEQIKIFENHTCKPVSTRENPPPSGFNSKSPDFIAHLANLVTQNPQERRVEKNEPKIIENNVKHENEVIPPPPPFSAEGVRFMGIPPPPKMPQSSSLANGVPAPPKMPQSPRVEKRLVEVQFSPKVELKIVVAPSPKFERKLFVPPPPKMPDFFVPSPPKEGQVTTKSANSRNASASPPMEGNTKTVVPVREGATSVDKNDPNVKKLVYNTYRGLLGAYNNKANDMIATLPRSMVREDKGIAKQLESLASQGGLEKLTGRINPKVENE